MNILLRGCGFASYSEDIRHIQEPSLFYVPNYSVEPLGEFPATVLQSVVRNGLSKE
jgi:hypothetical protein